MKDALGHGSDPRGGSSGPQVDNRKRPPLAGHPYHSMSTDQLRFIQRDAHEAAQNMRGFDANAEGKYLDQVNNASTVISYRDRGGRDFSASPAKDVAQQHGISTEHLNPAEYNSSGHKYGSPEALADFKREHGGPRDHAAEQRGFNSGKREINRLKRQGK